MDRERSAPALGENLDTSRFRSMFVFSNTGIKKSLLFFLFKLWTLTGIHFPCLGWITTVFLTFAIKTFFFLMVGLQ